jgi:hypothetical protein
VNIAIIIGTNIAIITGLKTTGRAGSFVTSVIQSTTVIVIARSSIPGMHTFARVSITRIIGTQVTIIAVFAVARNTLPVVANIGTGTSILVRARSSVIDVYTITSVYVARIISTKVHIIAGFGAASNTCSEGADIIQGTGVTIRARSIVVRMHTFACVGVARIIGTHIHIIAVFGATRNTCSEGADVIQGTSIIIAARCNIIVVRTLASSGVTRIVGTHIVIVTELCATRCAYSFVTSVIQCTSVSIITRSSIPGVHTFARVSITRIIGTQVTIVAVSAFTRNTLSVVAKIGTGTGVTIRTWEIVVLMCTLSGANIA